MWLNYSRPGRSTRASEHCSKVGLGDEERIITRDQSVLSLVKNYDQDRNLDSLLAKLLAIVKVPEN